MPNIEANPPKMTNPKFAAIISFSSYDEAAHNKVNEKVNADDIINVKLNLENLFISLSFR